MEGVKSAAQLSCSFENESDIFYSLIDEIIVSWVNTACHVPRNV